MLRILMINDCSCVAKNLAEGLNKHTEHHASCILPPQKREKRLIQYYCAYVRFIFRLWRDSKNLDWVIIHWLQHGFLQWFCRCKTAIYCHGSDVRKIHSCGIVFKWLQHRFLDKACVVFYSTLNLEHLLSNWKDKAYFQPGSVEDIYQPDVTCFDPKALTVFIASKLDPTKGNGAIGTVLEDIVQLNCVSRLTVFDYGKEAARLKIPNSDKIQRIPCILPVEEFLEIMNQHAIIVGQISVYGSFGMTELQALMQGKLVTTKFEYMDAYKDPPPFLLVQDGKDVVQHIKAIGAMDKTDYADYAHKAKKWVLQHHSQHVASLLFIQRLEC